MSSQSNQFTCIPFGVLDLGGECISVYATLAKFAGSRRECWPSMKTLEQSLGWTEFRIRPAITKLIEAGYIEKQRRDEGGRDLSSLYLIKSPESTVPSEQVAVPNEVPSDEAPGTQPRGRGYLATRDELDIRELDTKEKEKILRIQKKETREDHPGFEEFYLAYPLKIAKAKAKESWNRHRPDLAVVLVAIANQKADREKRLLAKEWVPEWPHPTTWINQSRWEDVVEAFDPDGPPGPPPASNTKWNREYRRWIYY